MKTKAQLRDEIKALINDSINHSINKYSLIRYGFFKNQDELDKYNELEEPAAREKEEKIKQLQREYSKCKM